MFKEVALDILQKQYGYTNVSDLMIKRATVWDNYLGDVSERFITEILDYNTCIPEALDFIWGRMLKVTRTFAGADGENFTLTDDQFLEIIKIRAFGTIWDGSVYKMNRFLQDLFKNRGTAYVQDSLDMKYEIFVFDFMLEPWEEYLFLYKDILPRPAGVGIAIYNLFADSTFGFEGTEFQPFNQGVLWNGQLMKG